MLSITGQYTDVFGMLLVMETALSWTGSTVSASFQPFCRHTASHCRTAAVPSCISSNGVKGCSAHVAPGLTS